MAAVDADPDGERRAKFFNYIKFLLFYGSAILLIYLVDIFTRKRHPTLRTVAILVLGDVGRSPRMMYHAESFAKIEFDTYLIGYQGSKPIPSLTSLPHIHFCYLPEPPSFLAKVPFIFAAPVKILHQIITILYTLLCELPHPPEFILVQNPPSIPTLALVWLVGHIRGSKVIIDWHNLGYSILALKLGKLHPFVRIAKQFEIIFGSSAYAHLFVTKAMHDHLVDQWGLVGRKAVLHDRPPAHFHRCSPNEVHELFLRLGPSLRTPSLSSFLPAASPPYATAFTRVVPTSGTLPPPYSTLPSMPETPTSYSRVNMPSLRVDRPALLVSSTSWTPDEDFSILLDALKLYEARAREANRPREKEQSSDRTLPRIWMVITGKGPDKKKYMEEVDRLQQGWEWVRCTSLWLEAEDYPLLLGAADLGICLHSSSSALDLPMKIVDMFGCGLPVSALDFACLNELVKDGQNGLIFKNAKQLADQMEQLLASFPHSAALAELRMSLIQKANPADEPLVNIHSHEESQDWEWSTWTQNWNRVVKPLVLRDADRE
ncbi:glycosyltransferase family 33 protein [Hygrophoropsis aurantiaca]|uniref:Glycosyltransferase family 33 protein n=1 Tax=Hygrophoropsis aurantiaca TaxID=72124 RepID=A0ACB8A5A1_9AGAM|nr:glycosyltransferase family 33 protein [Hygrophoropsis aurantiaca]